MSCYFYTYFKIFGITMRILTLNYIDLKNQGSTNFKTLLKDKIPWEILLK